MFQEDSTPSDPEDIHNCDREIKTTTKIKQETISHLLDQTLQFNSAGEEVSKVIHFAAALTLQIVYTILEATSSSRFEE